MLRWFSDFEHIVSYVIVKLFILSLLLMAMWMLLNHHFQADKTLLSMLVEQLHRMAD